MGNQASAIVILSVCPKRAITLEIELLSNTPFFIFASSAKRFAVLHSRK